MRTLHYIAALAFAFPAAAQSPRDDLAEAGITFAPYVIIDWSQNVQGGLDIEHSALRHLLSVNATIDMTRMLGWSTGKFYIDFQNQNGDAGSDSIGDYQTVGSWDADGLSQISELWFEIELAEGAWRIKVGKVDANWEFAYSELGYEFVHGSVSYPATFYLLPMYPDPAWFFNHSCDPNCGYDTDDSLVALRVIEPGQEIVYDYAMTETQRSLHAGMICRCGSPQCRGVLDFADWQNEEWVRRYGDKVTSHIAKRIARRASS